MDIKEIDKQWQFEELVQNLKEFLEILNHRIPMIEEGFETSLNLQRENDATEIKDIFIKKFGEYIND